jgi:hypothetical protein
VLKLVACSLVMIGCLSDHHVAIQAPPPNLTPDQRVAAYQSYRRGGEGVEIETSCTRGVYGGSNCSTQKYDLLLLRNGAEIREADDLLPLLPPNSVAARGAREVADAHRGQRRWRNIGWGVFLGGVGLIALGVKADVPDATGGGIVAVVASPFVAIIGILVAGRGIKDSTKTTFANYDQALAERFDVCVNGLAVVACENSTPGNPPPPEPDPALRSLRQK